MNEIMYIGRCYNCRRAASTSVVGIAPSEVTTHGVGLAAGKVFVNTVYSATTAAGIGLRAFKHADGTFSVSAACKCGWHVTCQPVRGRVSHHKCGPKCVNATGHDCECQCGGKNHGRGHALAA